MKTSAKDIGEVVKSTRKRLGATQKELALTSGTGLRFIIELERGKATCQLGKVLTVLNTLGVQTKLIAPAIEGRKAGNAGHGQDS
jgi:HTH-type transcriptional regulator / antitoxin HipB